jgi:hypothetical protein
MTDTVDNITDTTTTTDDLDAFLERYMQMWNEPDAATRAGLVHELWAPDALNATPNMQAVGHDEIVARVTRSYDAFVGTGVHRFRTHVPAVAHHGAVRVWWEMVTADETVVALGHELLMLGADGRIISDHQFPVEL